jgi:hypothetical protein
MSELDNGRIRQVVRERYAGVAQDGETGCCGPSTCSDTPKIDAEALSQAMGYSAALVLAVPVGANPGAGLRQSAGNCSAEIRRDGARPGQRGWIRCLPGCAASR